MFDVQNDLRDCITIAPRQPLSNAKMEKLLPRMSLDMALRKGTQYIVLALKEKQICRFWLCVSELCVGCMTIGEQAGAATVASPEDKSRSLTRQAYEGRSTFFDTANIYSVGPSKEILWKVLWDLVPRDDVVLATNVFGDARTKRPGLSRRLTF
jgi:Aldo/keto reductase family